MQLKDYVAVVRKRWWVFLLCVAVTASAAYGFSKLETPMYRSAVKLYVQPSRSDLGLTLTAQNLVRQYSQLLSSDRFMRRIDEQLNLDLPPPLLRSRIKASGTADNLAIEIQADSPIPDQARDIAGALAAEFVADQERRMAALDRVDRIQILMYDDPSVPVINSPQTRLNVIAGAALGLLIAVAIVFILEYIDDTIKNDDDVERFVSLPVIGSIPTISVR